MFGLFTASRFLSSFFFSILFDSLTNRRDRILHGQFTVKCLRRWRPTSKPNLVCESNSSGINSNGEDFSSKFLAVSLFGQAAFRFGLRISELISGELFSEVFSENEFILQI